MRLAFPWALLLLIPVAKMILDHRFRKTAGDALHFSSLEVFGPGFRTVRQRCMPLLFWVFVLALTLLIVALSRPQRIERIRGIPKEGIAIELAVDISSSMDISMPFRDSSLSRMEVAKQVISRFVADRPNDLIGMVTFARYADTVCPLTFSHDSLQYLIGKLEIESRPNEDGTAFGDALALSSARLRTVEERYNRDSGKPDAYAIKSKVVVLLTDGNNNCGRHLPMEAAALAKKWDVRVHTIAIVDPPQLQTIQTPDGPVQVEAPPPVQERILRRISETTGGIYRRATDEASLRDVYAEINALETSVIETANYELFVDLFQPVTAAAVLLLALHGVLSSTWLRRIP